MSSSGPAAVIILAAGEGTRMRTALPKMLNEVCGRAMLGHVITAAAQIRAQRTVIVASDAKGQVARYAAVYCPQATVVVQERNGSWGTGHAVRTVVETLGGFHGTVIVVFSDTPMLRGETLAMLAGRHEESGAAVTVLTAQAPDPTGYGRIIRDEAGQVTGVIEEADASPEQRRITEVSSGIFAFDGDLLSDAIKRLPTANAAGEEYLTDVPAILNADGHKIGSALCADFDEVQGVNDQAQLARARRVLNERLLTRWLAAGVTIVDPASTWIDVDVTLEPGVSIGPGTQLEGRTFVGSGASIGPGCLLRAATVGPGATVLKSVCEATVIEAGATIGPFAHITGQDAEPPDSGARGRAAEQDEES